jgi:hypothetical protein
MARQLLIGQAGSRGISCIHLPLKQFAQKPNRIAAPILRQTQIRRQRAHSIIFGIVPQDQQIFFQRFGGLALLKKFSGALHPPGQLGSVRARCRIGHGLDVGRLPLLRF